MSAATQLREAATEIAASTPDIDLHVEHDTLASALVAALADLTVVRTGRTVSTGTYSYDYADLGDVVKLTRPVLARHGLVALTPVHEHGNGLACTVTILHASGQQMDLGPFPFPHGANAQATGSMVTYHRRYALVAALGMAAGDDDDGAAAKPAAEPPTMTPRALAKASVLTLCGGEKDKAAEAWAGIGGDGVRWGSHPDVQAADLYEVWVEQPKDDTEPRAEGVGDGS